jgi:hypothetical protein
VSEKKSPLHAGPNSIRRVFRTIWFLLIAFLASLTVYSVVYGALIGLWNGPAAMLWATSFVFWRHLPLVAVAIGPSLLIWAGALNLFGWMQKEMSPGLHVVTAAGSAVMGGGLVAVLFSRFSEQMILRPDGRVDGVGVAMIWGILILVLAGTVVVLPLLALLFRRFAKRIALAGLFFPVRSDA